MSIQRFFTGKAAFSAIGFALLGLVATVPSASAAIFHSHIKTVPPGHRIQLEFSIGGAAATAREGEVQFKSNLMSANAVAPAWYVGDNIMRATLPAPTDASTVTYTLVARNPAGAVESSTQYTINVSGPDLAPSKTARQLKLVAPSKYAAMGYLPGFGGRMKLNQGYSTFAKAEPPAPAPKPVVKAPSLSGATVPPRPASSAGTIEMADDTSSRSSSLFYVELAGSFVQVANRDRTSPVATVEYNPGFEGTIGIGMNLGAGFRTAIEASGGYVDLDCCDSDVWLVSPALTFAYHFPEEWVVRPFIGIGGGWFFADYDFAAGGGFNEDGALALGDIGLSVSLSDSIEFFSGYRFTQTFTDEPGLDDLMAHRGRLGFRIGL